jgi:hypothetical protein
MVRTYSRGEHTNSTDSEWASVADGIQYAIHKKQGAIHLENDNLGVIRTLQGLQARPRGGLARAYYDYIYELAHPLEWLAVRWIPRERNRADRLFRLPPTEGSSPGHSAAPPS